MAERRTTGNRKTRRAREPRDGDEVVILRGRGAAEWFERTFGERDEDDDDVDDDDDEDDDDDGDDGRGRGSRNGGGRGSRGGRKRRRGFFDS